MPLAHLSDQQFQQILNLAEAVVSSRPAKSDKPLGSYQDNPEMAVYSSEEQTLFAALQALEPEALYELIALMWLGRAAHFESLAQQTESQWEPLLALARQMPVNECWDYLASKALLATYLSKGMAALSPNKKVEPCNTLSS